MAIGYNSVFPSLLCRYREKNIWYTLAIMMMPDLTISDVLYMQQRKRSDAPSNVKVVFALASLMCGRLSATYQYPSFG